MTQGPTPALCRDCATIVPAGNRCNTCGSPRLLRHREISELSLAHLDCDAFYAAVEKRDRPELKAEPVLIGGGKRGVVMTACYIARMSGVRSAMPMFQARKLCPNAVVLRPDMQKYQRIGKEIREIMRQATPLVEPLSIDEAFIELAGTERLHGKSPAEVLATMAKRIESEVGITVSIGLSFNKFLAKIASDLDKPRGFSIIGRGDADAFLADQPVSIIFGIGKRLAARLARQGLRTLADVRRENRDHLVATFGSIGHRLYDFSRGVDERKVNPNQPAKSLSAETTFERDIADIHELERHLWQLTEKVSARLKAQNLVAASVTLKLKSSRFQSLTRSARVSPPTHFAHVIFEVGSHLLAKLEAGTTYRLIGIGGSELSSPADLRQQNLPDPLRHKRDEAEAAMDDLRKRFGPDSIKKGRAISRNR